MPVRGSAFLEEALLQSCRAEKSDASAGPKLKKLSVMQWRTVVRQTTSNSNLAAEPESQVPRERAAAVGTYRSPRL